MFDRKLMCDVDGKLVSIEGTLDEILSFAMRINNHHSWFCTHPSLREGRCHNTKVSQCRHLFYR